MSNENPAWISDQRDISYVREDIYRNVKEQNAELVMALQIIAEDECENYHGQDCWENNHTVGADYGAEAVCDTCIAKAALAKVAD